MADETETPPSPFHVQSVSRAMAILLSFQNTDVSISLAELARRTGMHKPTVLRLARTLATERFLVKCDDGSWRLGPSAGLIGARYQAQFDANAFIESALQELSRITGESASFFINEGNVRSCLMRVEGPHGLRPHVRSGELLPLERGSAGRVILAAMGNDTPLDEQIRRQGFYITRGERSAKAASISAAVYGIHRAVLGSVSISGPIERLTTSMLERHAAQIVRTAATISYGLSGFSPSGLKSSTWHP